MRVGGRDIGYSVGSATPKDRSDPVTDQTAPFNPPAAFDHDSTLVIALESSGKSREAGAIVPGASRQPRERLDPRDAAGLLKAVERWTAEASAAGKTIRRVVLTCEAGRDGCWIARHLLARGIELHIMHPASIPVDRKPRRAKTDRLDLDMLLRAFLAWLRGEPRACSMVYPRRGRGGPVPAGAGTRAAGERAGRAGEPHRQPAVPARRGRVQATPQESGGEAGEAARSRRRQAARKAAGGAAIKIGPALQAPQPAPRMGHLRRQTGCKSHEPAEFFADPENQLDSQTLIRVRGGP
jgi:hypothetical protein